MKDEEHKSPGLLARLVRVISPLVHHSIISAVTSLLGALAPLLHRFLGERSDIPIGIIVGLVVVYFGLNILTDRFSQRFSNLEISVFDFTVRLMPSITADRTAVAKEMALSLTYFERLKQLHSTTKLALLACAGTLAILSFKFPTLNLLNLATVSVAVLGLVALKEVIVEYRISNGLFGTTRSEAKELIDFLVTNSEDIDFTDSNGSIRKALLPQESKRREHSGRLLPGGASA